MHSLPDKRRHIYASLRRLGPRYSLRGDSVELSDITLALNTKLFYNIVWCAQIAPCGHIYGPDPEGLSYMSSRMPAVLAATAALSMGVVACSGADDSNANTQGNASASASQKENSQGSAKEKATKAAADLPPVCDLMPKKDVEKLTGLKFVKTDSSDSLSGTTDTSLVCFYRVNDDDALEIYRIPKATSDLPWKDQPADSHTTVNGWDTIIRESGRVVIVNPGDDYWSFVFYPKNDLATDTLVKVAGENAKRIQATS